MVLQRTLTTYVARVTTCNAARRYLRERNILSRFQNVKPGHWQFVMHIPTAITEQQARMKLADALHAVYYEPPKYEETEIEAASVVRSMGDSVSTRDGKVELKVLHGPATMFHSAATIELRFNTVKEAQDFFNRTVVRANPKEPIDE